MNILIKWNEMLIKAFVVFSRLRGQFDASFYEITFSRRPLREERCLPFFLKIIRTITFPQAALI